MNVYRGNRNGQVTVNGVALDPRLDIANHSPTGFAWGYAGSGPAQLALAILVHEYGEDLSTHPCHYQEFKREVITGLDPEFALNSHEIRRWMRKHSRMCEDTV